MAAFELTPQQQTAIKFDGSMVITACPGSGKTTVMAEKIRTSTSKLKDYQGVIAITFTVKASQELKARCKAEGHDTKQSFFGTIDSFCLKEIIYPFLNHLWGGNPSECAVVKNLTEQQEQRLSKKYKSFKLQDIYQDLEVFKQFYYEKTLWMSSFSALALYILKESSAARRYLRSKFTHVFIDEYQDSSETQHQLFLEIVALGLIGTAVGDIDQSIYAFRGSNPKHLNELISRTDLFQLFVIDLNHRSHPSIINYASRLLDPKCDLLEAEDCRVFRRVLDGNASNAAATISEWIDSWSHKKIITNLSNIGVFAKKEATLKLISKGLNVNHRLYVDSPLDSIGSATADLYLDLLTYRFSSRTTVQELLDKYLSQRRGLALQRNQVTLLRNNLVTLRTLSNPQKIVDQCQQIAEILSFEKTDDEASAAMEILQDEMLISLFKPIDPNEVQLMTLHKSKGLEFQRVFHFDLEEWSFPYREYTGNWNDPPHYPDLPQETNLHYVGITRAEEMCVLISTELRRNAKGNYAPSNPSYFLGLPQLEGLYK